jgi:hypothetical protein
MRTPEQTDIECSIARCGQTTPRRESDDYARAKGWHIWQDTALCPGHAGNTKREPTPVNLEGQDPLF